MAQADADPTAALLGQAPVIEALRAEVKRLAAFDAPGKPVPTVLLIGETGTGKGLLARVIHDSGPRAGAPFIDVNCAAIPEALLEAELFGFEAGAFTDAKRSKPGLFEAASGGTLFLDEIDALTLPTQSKVLKAIEEKRVRRLGAVEPRVVDVKLIAATQHELKALAENGRFRADLYHRLAVLVLRLPPLRARQEDVVVLADSFLSAHAAAHGLAPKHLTESARVWLRSYPWPGNVRELAHLAERVTLLSTAEEVTRETLESVGVTDRVEGAPHASNPVAVPAPPVDSAVAPPESAEAARIRAALARSGGNVVRAAQRLGIGRNALRYRMRRLGVGRDDAVAGAPPAPPKAAAAAAAPAPAWEQKPVAVVVLALTFPDSTAAAYEPWTVRRRWDQAVAERIAGFGGLLLARGPGQLTAVFGVPRALERAPQHAVQAALAIQRAAAQASGPHPEIRAAVHIGEVRLDTSAPDPVDGLLPVGDTFTTAERLVGHAGGGEVLVSSPAARRVARVCALVPRVVQLGPAESDRQTAYCAAVSRAAVSAETAAADGALTDFVGRGHEIDLLGDAFERTSAGSGQAVFIAGDAGIGKTRLLAEFRRRLDGQPHRWVEGHCAPYGTTTPFLPVIEGLRRVAEIDDEDDDATATAKLQREVERLGGDLAWTLPFVRQLLSLRVGDAELRDLDSASRRSELFRALRALTLRAAELTPVVLVIEDLHWVDAASEEYLAFVSDLVPTARVLLLLTHRSGYTPRAAPRGAHTRLALLPLSGHDAAAMAGAILGTPEVPEPLRALVTAKAEGNPFFVEELTKSLLEDGTLRRENGRIVLTRPIEAVQVPDTIQDVLIARLDRLAEESRRAIQVAAVIGREFAMRLLTRISDAGEQIRTQVEELRSLELIYEKALHPELAYMFKHALTHDVAYESVVSERRKTLHRTIGLAIEELYADRLGEHYETLAHHFECADEWEPALRYHELSAAKAAANYANQAVVEHCRRALAIAARLGARVGDDVRRALYEQLARACFYLSEFAESGAAHEQAGACSDDGQTRAFHLSGAGFSHFWGHRYEDARRCVDAALALARAQRLGAGEARALTVLAFSRGVHDASLDDYEKLSREALAICERYPDEPTEALAWVNLAMVAEWTGSYAAAAAQAERAIALGRKLRLPEVIIFATWFSGKARCCMGDFGGAITLLDEACQLCDRIGDRAWKSRMLNTLGWTFAEIGTHERAREYNERAAILARDIGDPEIGANAEVNLALNHLALGDVAHALDCLAPIEAALETSTDPWMRWRYALHVQHARAEIELGRGELERVLRSADAERAGACRHRAPKVEARALALQARALLAADRRAEAEQALRAALSIAARIGYRRGEWEGRRLLAQVARRRGDGAAASEQMALAHAAIESAAGSLKDGALRRTLLAGLAVS